MVGDRIDLDNVEKFELDSRKYVINWIEESFSDQPDILEYLVNVIRWLDNLEKNCAPYLYRMIPLAFALDVGIKDQVFLRNISNASLLGFIISIVNDRALDENDRQAFPVRWVYISFILYSKYVLMISELNQSLENKAARGSDFLQFEKEAFIGMFREDKIHFNFQLNKYEPFDVSYRCSQIKTLMNIIAIKSEKIDPELISRFCDIYSFGMCIVDDMEDWEVDFDNGRFTYAIQYAMNQENISYSESEHDKIKQKLCKVLFFSPVYFQLRNEISKALNESLALASSTSAELKGIVIDSAKAIEAVTLEHMNNLRKLEDNFEMAVRLKNDDK